MKSIFDSAVKQECQERLDLLNSDSQKQWGKMDVGQMCAHCADVIDTYTGKQEIAKPPFMMKLMRGMIKKIVFGPKPYKKNNPTSPQFKQTTPKEFGKEKAHLITALSELTDPARREEHVARKHPLFGTLTEAEVGWSMYKHLDHHLTQFGV